MSKRIKKIKIKDLVRSLLVSDEGSRGNDERLYAMFCRDCAGIDLSELGQMMLDGSAPKFGGVSRRRRALQSDEPELRPSEQIQQMRIWSEENWEEHWAS